MMLLLPALLFPNSTVMGARRTAPVSRHDLKFWMRKCVSICVSCYGLRYQTNGYPKKRGQKKRGDVHHNHPRVRRWLSRPGLPPYFENAIPAKLTTLRSSMFHCSYRSNSPCAFPAAFRNV